MPKAAAKTLTLKQENFAQAYIESGNATQAYRQAYNCEKMKPETVNKNAYALLQNNQIATRIEALRAELAASHRMTKDKIIEELLSVKTAAVENLQFSAAVSSLAQIIKMLGYDKPEQATDMTIRIIGGFSDSETDGGVTISVPTPD